MQEGRLISDGFQSIIWIDKQSCKKHCRDFVISGLRQNGAMKGEDVVGAFYNSEFERHKVEAKKRWGQTDAYKEHAEKTRHYSKNQWNSLAEGMNEIFGEFAACMKSGAEPGSAEAQGLVKRLQDYITEHYYRCTNEILAGLGQMYAADERFRINIDRNADGTAAFVCEAIKVYCGKSN